MTKKRNPLNRNHQTKTRQSFVDYDYVNKLSPTDRKFLSQFTDEYYGGVFKESDDKNLIKGEQNHRSIWRDDWHRRQCQFNLAQIGQLLTSTDVLENVKDNTTLSLEEILEIVEKRVKFVSQDQIKALLQEIKEFYNCSNN